MELNNPVQRPDLEYSEELVRKGTEKTNDEGQIKAFVGEESAEEMKRPLVSLLFEFVKQ